MRAIERRGAARAAIVCALVLGCEGAVERADAGPRPDASERCGDGVVDGWEGCDDGNAITGDGCTRCMREHAPSGADGVLDAPGASGEGFGDPERAVNGVYGGGERMQSLDVFSIGIGPQEWLVVGWDGLALFDGPGADLAVFENAFRYGGELTFIDAAIVELSADGTSWVTLPHDYVAPDESAYSAREEHWIGFAGVTPVLLHEDENPVDPFDPAAGGDRFDLADLPATPEADRIRREGARYVRIVAAASRVNPDTGEPFPRDPVSDGPDIDGVIGRYLVEAP